MPNVSNLDDIFFLITLIECPKTSFVSFAPICILIMMSKSLEHIIFTSVTLDVIYRSLFLFKMSVTSFFPYGYRLQWIRPYHLISSKYVQVYVLPLYIYDLK